MFQFIQPILSLLMGLALSLYGLIHSSMYYPSLGHLKTLWQSMPSLTAVLIFMLGIAAVISGLFMLTTGVQGLRLRYRQIDHTYSKSQRENYDEDYDPSNGYQ